MATANLLAEAVKLARKTGYQIREDCLDGAGGGHCQIHGGKWLLLDVTQSLEEQLSDTVDALRVDPQVWQFKPSPDLAKLLEVRRAA